MNEFLRKIFILFKLKLKFAAVSLVATSFDFLFYSTFVLLIFPLDGTDATRTEMITVTAIGGCIAVLINFFLQKRFVFDLKRKVSTTFILALCISLLGIVANTGIVAWLSKYAFFVQDGFYRILPKIIATGIVFFPNFYMRRFVFEKRFFSID